MRNTVYPSSSNGEHPEVTIASRNIVVYAQGQPILQNPHFEAYAGELTGIVGPSGCGKTTLLNVLGLLMPPHEGEVVIGGRHMERVREKERLAFWADEASFVFQDYGIIEEWSVIENILLDRRTFGRARITDESRELLSIIGLEGKERTSAALLSGGEKQRVGIARAIHKGVRYIFADEPTASLDAENRALVIELLSSAARRGATVIVATHDADMMAACDRLCRLESPTRIPDSGLGVVNVNSHRKENESWRPGAL